MNERLMTLLTTCLIGASLTSGPLANASPAAPAPTLVENRKAVARKAKATFESARLRIKERWRYGIDDLIRLSQEATRDHEESSDHYKVLYVALRFSKTYFANVDRADRLAGEARRIVGNIENIEDYRFVDEPETIHPETLKSSFFRPAMVWLKTFMGWFERQPFLDAQSEQDIRAQVKMVQDKLTKILSGSDRDGKLTDEVLDDLVNSDFLSEGSPSEAVDLQTEVRRFAAFVQSLRQATQREASKIQE